MAGPRRLLQPKYLIGAVAVIALLWLSAKIARGAYYLHQLDADRAEITDLARAQSPFTHGRQWQDALLDVDQNLRGLAQAIQPMIALGALLGPSNQLHATANAVSEILAISHELIAMGQKLLSFDDLFTEDGNAPTRATQIAVLARHAQELTQLAEQAKQLENRLNALPLGQLPSALAEPLQQSQALANLLTATLQMAPAAPQLLGFDRPQTYLLLVQNNHELRATGGFITAAGLLKVTAGDMELLDFVDSYEIANSAVQHPWAPAPMQRYLGIDLLFLRDANWSPDFATTAQLARTLYAQNQGVWVDGVIALDLHAVELLVDGVGSVRVDGVAQPITRANFQMQMKEFWRNAPTVPPSTNATAPDDWWRQRKDFMPLIAKALLDRISGGAVDFSKLTLALLQALDARAVQLWVVDTPIQEALARAGWDGALKPEVNADFLALVDSNFGYNKVDSVLQRSVSYQVDWPADSTQPAQAVATITYRHALDAVDPGCDHTPRYGDTYDDMAARCYFDYVRLYTPRGSRLIDVDGVDRTTVQSASAINGTQLFSAYFELPPGQTQQITFYYELPLALQRRTYRLLFRRQAGAAAYPVDIDVAGQTFQTVVEKGEFLWQPTP
ncbi:MAG: DUF4012 domain-containing protein [Caldilineaceae bacterium]|nr:DUF4012 domain-containing protein [Caldilineaceae bacterium]